jgi:hypothetical protein
VASLGAVTVGYDQNGAIMPEKPQKPTQRTEKGLEIPIPKREDVERDLRELVADAKPLPPKRGRSPKQR